MAARRPENVDEMRASQTFQDRSWASRHRSEIEPLARRGLARETDVNAVLKILAGLPALGFVIVGLAWWIAPEFAGAPLGMDLLSGAGLSTQIADLAAFFLTLGGTILIGLVSGNRVWFFPPIMLLAIAIVGRLIAWLAHGADLTFDMIAIEAVVVAILVFNVRAKSKQSA